MFGRHFSLHHLYPRHQFSALARVVVHRLAQVVQCAGIVPQVLGVDLAEVRVDAGLIVYKFYRAGPEGDGQWICLLYTSPRPRD